MKALEILIDLRDNFIYGELHGSIHEAIKELEELENRSCIGCINLTRSNSQDCISCSRQYQDNFKIIKNKDKITNI